MSGKCAGVHDQEKIRTIVPQALYNVHCFAHRLNLVIVKAVKSIVPVTDFSAALQLCYNFLSGSNVHSRWIAFQKDMYPNEQPVEFKTMSDTRWACQVRAVSAIISRFECLIKFLRHVDNTDDNRERALVARNVLDQIDQKFIYCMLLMHDLLLEALCPKPKVPSLISLKPQILLNLVLKSWKHIDQSRNQLITLKIL